MDIVAAPGPDGVQLAELDPDGRVRTTTTLDRAELPGWARRRASRVTRWVWPDTAAIYPGLLRAGVRLERAYDLRLTGSSQSGV